MLYSTVDSIADTEPVKYRLCCQIRTFLLNHAAFPGSQKSGWVTVSKSPQEYFFFKFKPLKGG